MVQKQHTPSNVTKRVSFSIIAISLPFIYVSFLHIPLSSLSKDTTFWFLISNSIIFIVASIDSSKFADNEYDMYDEYVRHSKSKHASSRNDLELQHEIRLNSMKLEEPNQEITKLEVARVNAHENIDQNKEEEEGGGGGGGLSTLVEDEGGKEGIEEKQVVSVKEEVPKCGRSKSELGKRREGKRRINRSRTCAMEENEYVKMSNEELNKRVEEFIRRFNRGIRLEERMIHTSVC